MFRTPLIIICCSLNGVLSLRTPDSDIWMRESEALIGEAVCYLHARQGVRSRSAHFIHSLILLEGNYRAPAASRSPSLSVLIREPPPPLPPPTPQLRVASVAVCLHHHRASVKLDELRRVQAGSELVTQLQVHMTPLCGFPTCTNTQQSSLQPQ